MKRDIDATRGERELTSDGEPPVPGAPKGKNARAFVRRRERTIAAEFWPSSQSERSPSKQGLHVRNTLPTNQLFDGQPHDGNVGLSSSRYASK